MEAVSAILNLHATPAGEIAITVSSPFRGDPLSVDDTVLTLNLWAENADVIRGRFQLEESQEIAYFQSSGPTLRRLAELIHLVGPRSE